MASVMIGSNSNFYRFSSYKYGIFICGRAANLWLNCMWPSGQSSWLQNENVLCFLSQSQSYITTDSQSVSKSWCRAQSGTSGQRSFFFFWKFLSCHLGAPSLTRGRVCHLSVYNQSTVVSQYLHKIFTYCVTHIWHLEYLPCGRHIHNKRQ
jgi:hypothetical protein